MTTKPTHGTHCVRCNTPHSSSMGQVRATCAPCAQDLATMHYVAEYTFLRKRYYIPSLEGATFAWLLHNGYANEVYTQGHRGPFKNVKDQVLVNTS